MQASVRRGKINLHNLVRLKHNASDMIKIFYEALDALFQLLRMLILQSQRKVYVLTNPRLLVTRKAFIKTKEYFNKSK